MKTKTAVLAGLAAAMLTVMSARAQQAAAPENALVPEMLIYAEKTGEAAAGFG